MSKKLTEAEKKRRKKDRIFLEETESFFDSVKRGNFWEDTDYLLPAKKWKNPEIRKFIKESEFLYKKLQKIESEAYGFCSKKLHLEEDDEDES
jgi:hypothetical protein